MRNNYSAADHDPGDEDPTERVKRALLEALDDLASGNANVVVACFPPANPTSIGEVRTGHSILSLPWSSSPWPWLV